MDIINNKTVNIIGGGIGGLYTGAILAKHGFKVSIFESNHKVGGYATSWKKGDYLFEGSLHEMNGFAPDDFKLRVFHFLDLFKNVKFLKIPSPYTMIFKDLEFKIPHNSAEFREKLIKQFPDDEKGIINVFKLIAVISKGVYDFLRKKNKLSFLLNVPRHNPKLLTHIFLSLAGFLKRHIKNGKVRTILGQLFLYYSDNIKNLSVVTFFPAIHTYFDESYWISGTSENFAIALKNVIEQNNGNIYTKKKVTKVLFKNNKAIGIQVNNTEEYFSDITICNSSLKETLDDLIGKEKLPFYLKNKSKKMVLSPSIFSLYIGLKIDVKKLGIEDYCYIFSEDDDIIDSDIYADHEKRTQFLVSYNLDDSLTKEGKTVVNICMADKMDYWENIYKDKDLYLKEKQRIADILINRVEKRFPGFKENIEVCDISTPYTMQRFSGNTRGAIYGLCQNMFQSHYFRFPNRIKSRNLYFASGWVFPSAGFSGVFLASYFTSNLILKKYGIRNLTDDYKYLKNPLI